MIGTQYFNIHLQALGLGFMGTIMGIDGMKWEIETEPGRQREMTDFYIGPCMYNF